MPKRRDPYAAERTVPLTVKELQAVFGVTNMTVYLWRQGTPTKAKLPTAATRGRSVRFEVQETLDWARKHDIPVEVHPDDLGRTIRPDFGRKKPGPKSIELAARQAFQSDHLRAGHTSKKSTP